MIQRILIFLLLLVAPVYAANPLSPAQRDRIMTTKQLLADVDKHSLAETVKEIEGSPFPEGILQLREAAATTYSELINEYAIVNQTTKENLYNKILLNLAYIQMGGAERGYTGGGWDKLIQQKLRAAISPELLEDRRLVNPVR